MGRVMTSVLSPEELAARTRRAVDAAAAAGRAIGLEVSDPQVRYDVFSVIVELAPSPVVVRVPTVLPSALVQDEQRAQQVREVAVAAWLAGTGHPAVTPAEQVPKQPVEHDGFSMTFWTLVDVVPAPDPTPQETGRQIAALHAALAPCPVELRFMVPLDATVPAMLDELRARPDLLDAADRDRARRQWDALAPVLTSREAFTARFPGAAVQPVHGDSPAYNVLHTPDGPLDSDFEHVTVGPVEWDLAFGGPPTSSTRTRRLPGVGWTAACWRSPRLSGWCSSSPASRSCPSYRCWPRGCGRPWSTGARPRRPASCCDADLPTP